MMDKVATVIRLLILVLCVLLFWAGALWNLCVQPETAETSGDVNLQEGYAPLQQKNGAAHGTHECVPYEFTSSVTPCGVPPSPQGKGFSGCWR